MYNNIYNMQESELRHRIKNILMEQLHQDGGVLLGGKKRKRHTKKAGVLLGAKMKVHHRKRKAGTISGGIRRIGGAYSGGEGMYDYEMMGGRGTKQGAKHNPYIQCRKKYSKGYRYLPGIGCEKIMNKKVRVCKNKKHNPWIEFVCMFRQQHPNLSYKEALKRASVAYHK